MGHHYDRGQALFALERYAEAIAEYQLELAENPQCAASKANIAASLVNLNRHREAKEAAREVLGMAPEYAYAFYVLSFVESNADRDSPAQQAIGEALRLQPSARHFCRLGWLLRAQGRYAECLQATADALALDARHQESLVLRAKALDALHRPDEAAELLRSALAINPENPDAHQLLGAVALANGDPVEALNALREARRISPVQHHDRDRILDAYARRMWPFRQLDRPAKRLRRISPVRRWAIDAAILTCLIGFVVATRPDVEESSPVTTVAFFVAANAYTFYRMARHYPVVLIRFILRRELDLRWGAVLRASGRSTVKLLLIHVGVSLLAVWLSMIPFLAFFVLASTLGIRRLEDQRRLFGGEASALFLLPIAGMLALGVYFNFNLNEHRDLVAVGCWGVVLAFGGAYAALLQWLRRRRLAKSETQSAAA